MTPKRLNSVATDGSYGWKPRMEAMDERESIEILILM